MNADLPTPAPAVVLEAVTKSFGNGLAVDRVSFQVESGTCFGLLGSNGAGKSTTLKMIYGVLRPTSGKIRVAGIDVAARPRAAKRCLGVAPQDDVLDPDLTASQNLLFHARYAGMSDADVRSLVPRLLEQMGLEGRGSDPVHSLSAGLRRRLVLARAMVNDPSILILDEPTRGLDRQSREQFVETLQQMKGRGVTLLLATHDMDEARALCDRAALMEAGSLRELGPTAVVFRAADRVRRLPELRGGEAC